MSAYRTQSADTDPRIEAMLFERLRRLSPVDKVAMIRQACRAAETWKRAGLRHQDPDASEEDLRIRAGVLRLGPELVSRVFGTSLDRHLS